MSHLLSEFHFNALQKKNVGQIQFLVARITFETISTDFYNILCLIYLLWVLP